MKVLYIEDTPAHVRAMQKIAAMAECDLVTASTGSQAFDLLSCKPDVIILDLVLPDMDGFALAQQLRTKFAHVPIIAVSASGLAEDRERALLVGCTAYISKPFRFLEMVERLQTYRFA